MSDLLHSKILNMITCYLLADSYSSILCSVSLRAEGISVLNMVKTKLLFKHPALLKHRGKPLGSFKCCLKYTKLLINRRLFFFIQAKLQREHLFEIDLPSASFNVVLNSAI